MAYYRLYFLEDDHFCDFAEMDCETDAQAVGRVNAHADGRAMELWQQQRSVRRYEAADTGRRAVYNLDKDLRFVSANATALRYWRRSRSEIVGRHIQQVFPKISGSDSHEAHLGALRSLRPFRGIVRSPLLRSAIDLEIHPAAEGLRVSFAKCGDDLKREADE